MPLISVVIPVYNRPHRVVRAIESIWKQDFQDFELIVVDDGSTDSTGDVLRALQGRLRYVRQQNSGPGAARNYGVQHAAGEWVAFLDSDDTWLPNKLSRQMAWAQSVKADVCFHDALTSEGEAGSENRIPRLEQIRRQMTGLRRLNSEILPDSFRLLVEAAQLFLTTSLLLKRDAFMAVGGMNCELLTNQDIELYLRLFPRYRVGFLNETLAVYSPGENRAFQVASHKTRQRLEQGKSRILVDRIRAYAKAFEDRAANSDTERADIAREGIVHMLRTFAGHSRRTGAFSASLNAYICCALLRVLPFANPVSLLRWNALVADTRARIPAPSECASTGAA